MQIAQRLEQLSVTREEYYLLKALVLVNCDVRVESFAHVKRLRENILSALSDCANALRCASSVSFSSSPFFLFSSTTTPKNHRLVRVPGSVPQLGGKLPHRG